MSFKEAKETIECGDVVILYLNPSNMHAIEVIEKIKSKNGELVDNVFQTTYGSLKVISLVGKQYGTKIQLSKGWAYVLQPTPELWTVSVRHRTQIIYTPDISLITHLLELNPGKIVIETGTGSGSLSHSLIRAIQPSGHLYTFDFHEERVSVAKEEFQRHGLEGYVTIQHRDVCINGFGDNLNGKADVVFLDLPHPWLVISHALKALKESGGKVCSFSPCIEQVQQTCDILRSSGFVEIKTFECLQKELNVHYKNIPKLELDYLRYKQTEENGNLGRKDNQKEAEKVLTVNHQNSLAGHTGYITIATLPPLNARNIGKFINSVSETP